MTMTDTTPYGNGALADTIYELERTTDRLDTAIDVYDQVLHEHEDLDYDRDAVLSALVDTASEMAVNLHEQRDHLADLVHSTRYLDTTSIQDELASTESEDIHELIGTASNTVKRAEHAGATTDGGWTPPYPAGDVDPEYSLGSQYRQKLEDAADVNWVTREATWP